MQHRMIYNASRANVAQRCKVLPVVTNRKNTPINQTFSFCLNVWGVGHCVFTQGPVDAKGRLEVPGEAAPLAAAGILVGQEVLRASVDVEHHRLHRHLVYHLRLRNHYNSGKNLYWRMSGREVFQLIHDDAKEMHGGGPMQRKNCCCKNSPREE